MKPVVMTTHQWQSVLEEIKKREKPSVYLSRTKMKEVLGFTPRHHEEWVKMGDNTDPNEAWLYEGGEGFYAGKRHTFTVRLDFYDEAKRTMFLLKYGNGQ